MRIRLVIWFICFGLSFLVEKLGLAEQGKTFFVITLILYAILCIAFFKKDGSEWWLGIFIYIPVIAIILLATWVATKLFNIDYYVAFQIVMLGKCLGLFYT